MIKARMVQNQHGVALIRTEPAGCNGCLGCGVKAPRTFELPNRTEKTGTVIALSMSSTDQIVVLLNTLWLPLLGFIMGVVISSSLWSNEALQVCGALVGLVAGIACCRRSGFTRVNASSVIESGFADIQSIKGGTTENG